MSASRYLQVRYEDIAVLPALAAELLYCWTSLRPIPSSVLDWIDANTKLPECNDGHRARLLGAMPSSEYLEEMSPEQRDYQGSLPRKHRALNETIDLFGESMPEVHTNDIGQGGQTTPQPLECGENRREGGRGPYETRRQSTAMADMWRTQMPKVQADAVWEACEESGVMPVLGYDL